MTDDDDKPKPPRASWEPPEPDPPPVRKPRAPRKPPRASWELPEPEPEAADFAGGTRTTPEDAESIEASPAPVPVAPSEPVTAIPSVVVEPGVTAPVDPGPTLPAIEPSAPIPRLLDDPAVPLPSSELDKITPMPRRRRAPSDLDLTDHDDDGGKPGRNRAVMVIVALTFVALLVGVFVLFGVLNKDNYAIRCEADEVVAARGRGFPPWGMRPLEDGQWKPMHIPPEAECKSEDVANEIELSQRFSDMLVARAALLLQEREVTKIDEAAALLEQGLLHTRAPSRRDARALIERMLGDVQYWRASAKLRDAANALGDAAKQFDASADQAPRFVKDASAWATHVRRLVDELKAGPAGASHNAFPPTPPGADKNPSAPPGVALPVEPGRGSNATPTAPPDAGIPSGGVLL